jgi:hypothetical protein
LRAAGVPEISLVGSEPEKLDSVDVFKETSAKNKLKLKPDNLSLFLAEVSLKTSTESSFSGSEPTRDISGTP